jgi:hypothetical protein
MKAGDLGHISNSGLACWTVKSPLAPSDEPLASRTQSPSLPPILEVCRESSEVAVELQISHAI